ncbi:MAG: SpvB/TcaC N-terminal domain-containing protein [Acidobacteriota bacterium]
MQEDSATRTQLQSSSGQQQIISPPTISLPKGGGAIRGIGEKFAANPVTGTGSLSIPIYTSPGRASFSPQLSLSYDSGAGNGPFGFGWSLSLPSITRKTDKGLPKYLDNIESDIFILSGAEDLVPYLQAENDQWLRKEYQRVVNNQTYRIQVYRPRIEGLFARIERWTNEAVPSDTFWRSISRDNITTWYGKTTTSRIVDPTDSTRIFTWLICESYDDKGNLIVYDYKTENSDGVALSQAHERNRIDITRSSNRYIKRIKYGNRTPYYPLLASDQPLPQPNTEWLFEVVFDYGEHDFDKPTPEDSLQWSVREDPFSSYRAGFEVRTYRLCQRVLMFHHFIELGQSPCLVRSTDFTYSYENNPTDSRNPIFSFLVSATQSGYNRQANGFYLKKSLPSLEFQYSKPIIQEEIQEVDAESLENLPYALDGALYQWVDLDGEGVSGILTEQGEGWFYKRNLSPVNGLAKQAVRFGSTELIAEKPSLSSLSSGHSQFMDLAGDGQLDLVELQSSTPGFFERSNNDGWESLAPFEFLPNLDWNNPNLKFIDLTGDGHADILISENEAFCWYPSLAEKGFGPYERVSTMLDEEREPNLIFADATQSIYLADMSGDGLTDLVRIRNGEVCYWPNLGYGRFGAKVTMDNAPWFDTHDQFDQNRIRLADIDGSGVTDIIYIAADGIDIYFNQSGNSWSKAKRLAAFPAIDNLAAIQVSDLLGNGTACLVWSSPLQSDAGRQMRYIDLIGGEKPHLLIRSVNNLGAETLVLYAPSTKFYLADKLAGKPWITKIHFPVHVVERVEIYDRISGNRFVTRYAYHHGYFDGVEREFRGFGMVEQWDTEEVAALSESTEFPIGINFDQSSYVPPILTRSWFHTGVYLGRDQISNFYSGLLNGQDIGEYYREPGLSDAQALNLLLDDTVLPTGLTLEEEREACRALKGAMLRQEVYALDGTEKESHPYTVTEQNLTIRRLQPREDTHYAVFFTHARESISYHYERNPTDPRVTHALTLEVDDYGNVLKSAAIGYGRHQPDPTLSPKDQAKQVDVHIVWSENSFTNRIDLDDVYRTPLPSETRTYELTGLTLIANHNRFTFDEVLNAGLTASLLAYEQTSSTSLLQKRLIEHVRSLYRRNDLTGTLPLGQLDSLALPYQSYKLALTTGLITQIFADRVTESMLANDCRYVHSENDTNWWIPSGQVFLSAEPFHTPTQELTDAQQHFFLPRRFRNPFGEEATISYDNYDLLITDSLDALGNRMQAVNDYRVLQPCMMIDPNGNRSEVAFDSLGMVVGTAVMGKSEPAKSQGDSLVGFTIDLDESTILAHLENPFANPHDILQRASSRLIYDLFTYQRTQNDLQPQPATVYTLVRETHDADLKSGEQTKIQHSFSYSDGFGREIQKKIQAESGPLLPGKPTINPRWVGNGWTIFNNKGKAVRQFEPFFSETHKFESARTVGVSSILFYDPIGRVISTLHPNHSWEKVAFDPWRQETWDVNDTVLITDPKDDPDVGDYYRRLPSNEYLPNWYTQHISGVMGTEEQAAAVKAAIHTDTPTIAFADTLGRTFLTVADNRFERNGTIINEEYSTRVELDIEGNQRAVIDALNRIVMRYDYNLLGNQIHSLSMEAGERWMLNDVTGKPVYSWDSRNHRLRMTYDVLRRPVEVFLQEGSGPELMVSKMVYGESQPNAEENNLRGKPYQSFDGAGIVTTDKYDFKGNLLSSSRQFAVDYKNTLDWSGVVSLEAEVFITNTSFDALNRPVTLTTPDNSIIRPAYNEANFLERIEANLQGSTTTTTFIRNINYNSKGQREMIEYGNGITTSYEYDPLTFRLTHLQTLKGSDRLQDLFYIYDPAGNITRIRDDAQQTIYFNNGVIKAHADYTYDAIYRLISATGREHIGQLNQPQTNWSDEFRMNLAHPHDGQAMRRYTEQYKYDAVGNILLMSHWSNNGNWARSYAYKEASLIEPTKFSNRLSRTIVGGTTESYTHDVHGNMTSMPHLALMQWNYLDQLKATARQVVNSGTPETTYYVYDASGQRVRKITERQAIAGATPTRMKERIYVGGFEIYREYNTGGSDIDLERETLHIMDGQKRVAMVETRTQGNDGSQVQLVRYQSGNHLGSASVEMDETAQIISYEEYYPYGSTSYQAVNASIKAAAKRYRYTEKERDEETGLAYHEARYYAPWLGRWTGADPITSTNLYVYVDNRPLVASDPTGKVPLIFSLIGTAGEPPTSESAPSTTDENRSLDVDPISFIPLVGPGRDAEHNFLRAYSSLTNARSAILKGNYWEATRALGDGILNVNLGTVNGAFAVADFFSMGGTSLIRSGGKRVAIQASAIAMAETKNVPRAMVNSAISTPDLPPDLPLDLPPSPVVPESTVSIVDLVTSSNREYSFTEDQQRRLTRELLGPREFLVTRNRDRGPRIEGAGLNPLAGPFLDYPWLGRSVSYGTPAPYLWHGEPGGITAALELIRLNNGRGRIVAVGVAPVTRPICGFCTPIIEQLGLTIRNPRYAALPEVGLLGLENRALEIHNYLDRTAFRNRTTSILRVELWDVELNLGSSL